MKNIDRLTKKQSNPLLAEIFWPPFFIPVFESTYRENIPQEILEKSEYWKVPKFSGQVRPCPYLYNVKAGYREVVARFSVSRLPDTRDGAGIVMRLEIRNPFISCPSLVKFERNLRKLKGGIGIRVLHYRDRDWVDFG